MDVLSPVPRAPRAARYMSAMGLWRPLDGPGASGPMYELCPLLPGPSSIVPAMNIPLACVYLTLDYIGGLARVRLHGCCNFAYKL